MTTPFTPGPGQKKMILQFRALRSVGLGQSGQSAKDFFFAARIQKPPPPPAAQTTTIRFDFDVERIPTQAADIILQYPADPPGRVRKTVALDLKAPGGVGEKTDLENIDPGVSTVELQASDGELLKVAVPEEVDAL